MSKVKVRPRLADWRLFFAWDTAVVFVATAVLTVVELDGIPPGDIHDFVDTWKWLVVLVCLLLALLPPMVAKGFDRKRTLDQGRVRKSEVSTAVGGIQQRVSHLITKHREVTSGEKSNAYVAHTLEGCGSYFRSRRTLGGEAVGEAEPLIEVVFYRRKKPKPDAPTIPNVFECVKFTGGDANMFASTLSMRGTEDAKSVVSQALSGEIHYSSSFKENWVKVVVQEPRRLDFAAACVVPVHADRDTPAPNGVTGIMVVVSSDASALVASDKQICSAYAWCIAAAEAMDKTARMPHTVVRTPDFQARTQLS